MLQLFLGKHIVRPSNDMNTVLTVKIGLKNFGPKVDLGHVTFKFRYFKSTERLPTFSPNFKNLSRASKIEVSRQRSRLSASHCSMPYDPRTASR